MQSERLAPQPRQTLGKSHDDLREETRKLILASASELFIENGYSQSTMQMIAKKAGVSRSSLYRHFSSKWEVAGEIIGSVWPAWEAMWRNCPLGDDATIEAIGRWLRQMLSLLRQAKSYVFIVREIEAIEPEASNITIDVNDRLLAMLRESNPGVFSQTANVPDSAYYSDQLFLLQLDQFFYSSLRTSWDIESDAPIDAMAQYMKAFLDRRYVPQQSSTMRSRRTRAR